jgi:glycosyltransferase involved in cell wall biosynthesis|tara:strand:+ start:4679 stop:5530 length:852 start_codon:yes stop_codon:yes gene_type:complete
MISILIPTFNNLDYLKIVIESIKKNTTLLKYEILLHINDGSDGTLDYAKLNNISFSHSMSNVGLCTAINTVSKKANFDYFLYSHDDMYFCPGWDVALIKELKHVKNNLFYFSGTMIEQNSAHISADFGSSFNDFDEEKLLNNFNKLPFYNHQGSHFAPHLVHRDIWRKVGGFSEEFNPGMCSDPDFNMKLWKLNVRVFKGINDFRVYHFASVTTRKKSGFIRNNGDRTFLNKWGITSKFFKKFYLKSNTKYDGPLSDPSKSISYYYNLLICKIKFLFYLKRYF